MPTRIEELELALECATAYVMALADDEMYQSFADDMKIWHINVPSAKDIVTSVNGGLE